MVPMQTNSALSKSLLYPCFTILFILVGLTTLASSMNLLVLRLATINAEEQVQEKLEAAEALRQAVHLDGDVINPQGRLFITQETIPHQENLSDNISVCSCVCLDHKAWKFGRHRANKRNNKELFFFKKKSSITSLKENKKLHPFSNKKQTESIVKRVIAAKPQSTATIKNDFELLTNHSDQHHYLNSMRTLKVNNDDLAQLTSQKDFFSFQKFRYSI
jgi:hypothetical protein